MEQDADDAFERAMSFRAKASVADDAVDRAMRPRSDYNDADAWGAAAAAGSWQGTWESNGGDWSSDAGWNSAAAAEALPPGWEAKLSRSTGQTYYVNTYTGESQYELPAAAAEALPAAEPPRGSYRQTGGEAHSSEDLKYHSVRGPRSSRNDTSREDKKWAEWAEEPSHDPKSFLEFDAKGSNLQSSRQLFLQQMKERNEQMPSEAKKKKESKKKKKKRKRSSSSSSSSDSSRSKKHKRKSPAAAEKDKEKGENDQERIERIRRARQLRKESDGPGKNADGGCIVEDVD